MEKFQYHLLLSIILSSFCKTSTAFYGYDCGEQLTNLTTISLLDVGECEFQQPTVNITKTYGQLLQLNEFGTVRTYKCSFKVTRIVTHCGMHSHASRTLGGEISYYIDITRDACVKLHEIGYISFSNKQILGIKPNSTTHKTMVFAGTSSQKGKCTGGSFSDAYGNYEDVYVAGWVEIKLQDSYQPVRLDSNKIKLNSGVTCTFSDTTCVDYDGGSVFWTLIPEDTCGLHKYSILYEGNMDVIYELERNKIMYSLETEDITFALWKKGQNKICGYTVETTEHPKLFIVENARENGFMKQGQIATTNLDIFTYINSKFIFVEKFVRKQINSMYFDILKHKCELEKQIITNALALAVISPEEVAYRIMKGPGYLAVTAGEVIHLVKCLKVEITTRETKECYEQLPVFWNKKEYYLAPRTRILLRTGKQIPCERHLPPMFKLHNIWFKMLPEAVEVKNPETLKPQTKPTWQYVSPESLAVSGVYSQKDQSRLRDMILFPMERPSVLNKMALGVSGRVIDSQGMTLNNLLNPETLAVIAESAWNKMWTNFLAFGTASAGLIGIIMLCRLIKLLIDTIIHGYAIYSLYGFSIHLLGAIWNSVTQLLLHLGQQKHKNVDEKKNIENNILDEKKDKKINKDLEDEVEHVYENVELKPRLYPKIERIQDNASI